MKVTRLSIPDLILMSPTVYGDDRGFFHESFNQRVFDEIIGQHLVFVQDNHSLSARNTLRGLHYQIKNTQGKLVRVVAGAVFDVAVDLRKSSPNFGRWIGETLSAENMKQLWIPQGFAHGFLALSDHVEVLYKTTDYYAKEFERCIAWNDRQLGITWPFSREPILSERDRAGTPFNQADLFE